MLLTRDDNGKRLEVFMREPVEVRLPESQVSGYMWTYDEKDCKHLRLDDSEYKERGPARFNGLGERSWYFTPVMIGECKLSFSLLRPWSKPSPEYSVNIMVK